MRVPAFYGEVEEGIEGREPEWNLLFITSLGWLHPGH